MILGTYEHQGSTQQAGEANSVIMTEFETLKSIPAYIAKDKQQAALEAKDKPMDVEANKDLHHQGPGKDFDPEPPDQVQGEDQVQRLNAIYDD